MHQENQEFERKDLLEPSPFISVWALQGGSLYSVSLGCTLSTAVLEMDP